MKRILFSVIILALLLTACSGRSAEAPRATAGLPAAAESAPESAAPTAEPTPFTAPQTSGSEAAGSLRVNGLSSVLTLEPPADWTWEAVDGEHAGVALWPELGEDFRVTVTYWPEGFAQCGTGITEREVHVGENIPAVLMTEDVGGTMTWTLLLRTEDAYVLTCTAGGARFEAYSGGLNELLASLCLRAK